MTIDIHGRLASYGAERPPEARVEIKVVNPENGKHFITHALIDTGASTSVLPFDTVALLGFDYSKMPKVDRNTAGGIKTAYTAPVDIQMNGEVVTIVIDFALGWSVPIIGYNILNKCKLEIDYKNETFSLTE